MTLPFTSGRQWPEAHFEELKRHRIEGLSAAENAKLLNAKFGTAYTRCAVIGMIHRHVSEADRARRPAKPRRIVLEPRTQARVFGATKVPLYAKDPRTSPLKKKLDAIAAVLTEPVPVAGAAFSPLPGSTPKPWTERKYGECTWIVGGEGGDALSCCEPVEARGWCKSHLARGTAKPATEAQRRAAARARHAKRRAA